MKTTIILTLTGLLGISGMAMASKPMSAAEKQHIANEYAVTLAAKDPLANVSDLQKKILANLNSPQSQGACCNGGKGQMMASHGHAVCVPSSTCG
ncbi:MAG: hypothetical protein K0U29_05185 [Gammaproteobacteria bacterium]|nr:hypothetical protein [Gammaproteobacteria bacterium]MCH9744310.1 hypothetical protein [Gammaproteobacteria bacterium]